MSKSEVNGQRLGKHGAEDTRYLQARAVLSAQLGPQELWSVVDHWGLYTGIQTLGRALAFVHAVQSTLTVPGDIVEFGSWKGATLLLFAKILRLLDPHGVKVVHGFSRWDTGFTPGEWSPADNPDVAEHYTGHCLGEKAVLEQLIDLYQLQGAVELHDGDIAETWPGWLRERPHRPVSLALIDCDLYAPADAALGTYRAGWSETVDGLHERLSPGGMLFFDEAQHIDWPGEGQAAKEFQDRHPGAYDVRSVLGVRQPDLLLIKRGAA